jgi:hypothetical protein
LYVEDEEKTAPVEHEIRELSNALQMVKDEQAYLVVRERVHRDSESTIPRRSLVCGEADTVLGEMCQLLDDTRIPITGGNVYVPGAALMM